MYVPVPGQEIQSDVFIIPVSDFLPEDHIMTEPEESDPFHDLDWATLEDWAGTKTLSRGRQYQRDGRVHDLVRRANEAIVAWVDGTERYATAVYFDDGLVSECTCPVGDSCKHAVAVVLEYLALCEKKIAVPSLPVGDSRCMLLGIRPETDPAQVPPGTPRPSGAGPLTAPGCRLWQIPKNGSLSPTVS